jgi:hypothetical protein
MGMSLPSHISDRIRDAISSAGGGPIDKEARLHDAIALMGTIGAIWMLRADGSFWFADADSGTLLTPLPDQARTTALVAGSRRFPWLSELLPTRPVGAEPCPTCAGTGFLGGGPTSGAFCARCSALGWLPSDVRDGEESVSVAADISVVGVSTRKRWSVLTWAARVFGGLLGFLSLWQVLSPVDRTDVILGLAGLLVAATWLTSVRKSVRVPATIGLAAWVVLRFLA